MQRLLCLLSSVNMGGAETFLMKVYRALDRTRYQMDFCINVFEKCVYEDEIIAMGGNIYRIPPKSQDAKAFREQLSALIREHGYRNVLRVTSNAAGFWDLKIAKKAGAAHTIARSSNASDGSTLQYLIHRVSRMLLMQYVDVKLAPSDLAARYTFGERAVKRGEVGFLNNGLDLSVYRYDERERARVRAELGISADALVVGHIGRFNAQKNHPFLIKLFAGLLSIRPDAVLTLTGTGEDEQAISDQIAEAGIADHVIFTGLRQDIPALLSAIDVFVLPSLYEGMPNVAIEAQACGVPCLLADTITREANRGAAEYLPLDDTQPWISRIGALADGGRVQADMSGYDIREVAAKFCAYCFENEGEGIS